MRELDKKVTECVQEVTVKSDKKLTHLLRLEFKLRTTLSKTELLEFMELYAPEAFQSAMLMACVNVANKVKK